MVSGQQFGLCPGSAWKNVTNFEPQFCFFLIHVSSMRDMQIQTRSHFLNENIYLFFLFYSFTKKFFFLQNFCKTKCKTGKTNVNISKQNKTSHVCI